MERILFEDVLTCVDALGKGVITETSADVDARARFPRESFEEFKKNQLLSLYVPRELGGAGFTMTEICNICEKLGHYCASTAMIYAMHQIQVACIVHHMGESDFFRGFLRDLVKKQYLLSSATTELGVGGDLRSSICGLAIEGDKFRVEKKAPVISYALDSDYLLLTCRASTTAPASDQVHVVLKVQDCEFEPLSAWDTLGFRGTCSSGYTVRAHGEMNQVIPAPFADILAHTMHPVSHLTWGSLWTGLASDAVARARKAVRQAYKRNPELPPVSSLRLSEVDEQLFSMRSGLLQEVSEYQTMLEAGDDSAFSNFGFAIRINNAKLQCSEMLVDIVGKAMMVVGISGYRNDSPLSLCRHIRDAYGAAIMVNNDRIRGHNATLQIAMRD